MRYVDKYYPDGLKSEEQPMRNKITLLDPSIPKLHFNDLEVGEMFCYPKSTMSENPVYMKVAHTLGKGALYLNTGDLYTDFDHSKEIKRVTMVQISRPI